MNAASNRQHFRGMLAGQRLRITRQREAVLGVLAEAGAPLTVESVYLKLRERDAAICLSTVYRILATLAGKGLVTKSSTPADHRSRFALTTDRHCHHLVCLGCDRRVPIADCPLKELEQALHRNTNFAISGHTLEIYGYCPACQETNA
ncbi:MAG: Fur family transcriptional regulator [Bacillota bacterium]|nr:Fur family transcriptional regulator [Bacillota bacterium]